MSFSKKSMKTILILILKGFKEIYLKKIHPKSIHIICFKI